MKEYGLYDVKDYEQCIYIGTLKEISKYLSYPTCSLRTYLTRKKQGTYDLLQHRYELIEISEEEIEEYQTRKTDKEIIKEIIKQFQINFKEVIRGFPVYQLKKETFDFNYFQELDYEDEEWKKIGQFNYEISNYGRIKNITTKKLKQLKFNKYGMQVLLWQNSKSYTITISRLVAEMFIKPLNKNERVFHINNNIRDNYYKNLEIKQV